MNPASFARFSTQQVKIFRSIAHIEQSSKKYFAENKCVGRTRDVLEALDQRRDDALASHFASRREDVLSIVSKCGVGNARESWREQGSSPCGDRLAFSANVTNAETPTGMPFANAEGALAVRRARVDPRARQTMRESRLATRIGVSKLK